jgi:hypothetical protein
MPHLVKKGLSFSYSPPPPQIT